MAELAPGPAAGYIFQFELALAMLSALDNSTDAISIEKVDDVAIENEDDLVLLTVQSKHSISPNGTTFEDTSKALWRTFEIWILKLQSNELAATTKFVCATNKRIDENALIRRIKHESIDHLKETINDLLKDQKDKLATFQNKDKEKGAFVKKIIIWIEFLLNNWDHFKVIKEQLDIWDANTAKEKFLGKVHMNTDEYTQVSKDNSYQAMLGWLVDGAKAKWMNGKAASFSKGDFENKWFHVSNSPSLIKAVFRKKEDLGSIDHKVIEAQKSELFVKQIEDISRNLEAKKRKIENAIIDFICYDIEMTHLLVKNGTVTKSDFDAFRHSCFDKWQNCFDSHVIEELTEYTTEQQNALAIAIFDQIMDRIEVSFTDDIPFNTGNRYIRNGTFLKLSNAPLIGWHPDWMKKYKQNL
jgi:hypothetical protein